MAHLPFLEEIVFAVGSSGRCGRIELYAAQKIPAVLDDLIKTLVAERVFRHDLNKKCKVHTGHEARVGAIEITVLTEPP